jgi:hypothetical protein
LKYKNLIASKNILGVQSTSQYIGWSFGSPPFNSSEDDFNDCRIKINFTIDNLNNIVDQIDGLPKYHYWRCGANKDEIFYERTFLGGRKLRLQVSGILSGNVKMTVNRDYLRFIRFRFNNLHSPGYHLTDIACAMLLKQELTALHCSAFKYGNSTIVVVAPPDSGKTLTTMRAVFDYNAQFLAEDIAITDGKNIYSCPWTSTFRYYDDISKGWGSHLRNRLIKIFPPAELIPLGANEATINEYIGDDKVLNVAKVTHLVILSRKSGGVVKLSKSEASRYLLNLNRYEFPYLKNPLLLAYSYFNPDLNISELVRQEERILRLMVNNSECLLVQCEDARDFCNEIIKAL